jgi:hypothetical protein
MKKLRTLLTVLCAALAVNLSAQTQTWSDVIIKNGTDTGPALHFINETKTQSGIANRWTIYNMTGAYTNSLQFWAYDAAGCEGGGLCGSKFTLMDNGNVGIGTNRPQYKLDVLGDAQLTNLRVNKTIYLDNADAINDWGQSYLQWAGHSLVMGTPVNYYAHNSLDLKPGGASEGTLFSQIRMYDAIAPNQHELKIQITSDGNVFFNNPYNVGIGTENPQYKLDVKGEIRATKIRVESVNNFADFVFADDYSLRPLSEVKSHIEDYGHLPEIPTAAEVAENGIELVDMQVKLLQKIEELTLYIIEQDKRIEELENERR